MILKVLHEKMPEGFRLSGPWEYRRKGASNPSSSSWLESWWRARPWMGPEGLIFIDESARLVRIDHSRDLTEEDICRIETTFFRGYFQEVGDEAPRSVKLLTSLWLRLGLVDEVSLTDYLFSLASTKPSNANKDTFIRFMNGQHFITGFRQGKRDVDPATLTSDPSLLKELAALQPVQRYWLRTLLERDGVDPRVAVGWLTPSIFLHMNEHIEIIQKDGRYLLRLLGFISGDEGKFAQALYAGHIEDKPLNLRKVSERRRFFQRVKPDQISTEALALWADVLRWINQYGFKPVSYWKTTTAA